MPLFASDNFKLTTGRKKGIRRPETYRTEIQKRKRLRGEEYVSISTGNIVPAKSNRNATCSCKFKCTEKFSVEEKELCMKTLFDAGSKCEQDEYLMRLIDKKLPARRRPKKTTETPKPRKYVFVYHAMKGNEQVTVCRKAFGVLYCLKSNPIFRLASLKAAGESPVDLRGKHNHRGNAIPGDIRAWIDLQIREFPVKETHDGHKNVKYLSAELNVMLMHELFIKKHPDLTNKVKYDFYRKYFLENYGYRFGRPPDVCNTCEEITATIKNLNVSDTSKQAAVGEKIVHIHQANKFCNKQEEIKVLCSKDPEIGALVFDFMQNFPLPKMPVPEMLYLKKLWLYVFCIRDLKTDLIDNYVYPEGVAKRGPNEVCSMLWLKIQNLDPGIKELHFFSDACGNNDRNNSLVPFFLSLVESGRFRKIHQYFPVKGHSYLPCDLNFEVVKRKVRQMEGIYTPEQYINLFKSAKMAGCKFTAISTESILDFKNWWPKIFKNTTKTLEKSSFSVSQYMQLEFSPTGYLTASEYIDDSVKYTFSLQKPNTGSPDLPTKKAYSGNIPILESKAQDISKMVAYIPNEYKGFYEDLLMRPTAVIIADDSESDSS